MEAFCVTNTDVDVPKMLKTVIGMILLSKLHSAYGTNSCNTYVCFNWKVTWNELKLTCKVNQLHFKVWIYNQFGNVQAYCIPPSPSSKCEPYYKNGTISQNPNTNETTFTVHGYIDYHMNGNWTCRHGRRRDVAKVEVTVLRLQDNYNISKLPNNTNQKRPIRQDTNCITNVLLKATLSYLGSTILALLLLSFVKTSFTKIEELCERTSECACKNSNIATKILVCKRTTLALSTIFFLAVAILFGFFDDSNCYSQWAFIPIGLVFGCITSMVCLSNADLNVDSNLRTEVEADLNGIECIESVHLHDISE